VAPRRITDREELWAGPRNYNSRIGDFFVKLYETQPDRFRPSQTHWMTGTCIGFQALVINRAVAQAQRDQRRSVASKRLQSSVGPSIPQR
jgi:hypothetical protein